AKRADHLAVMCARLYDRAIGRSLEKQPDREDREDGETCSEELVFRKDQSAHQEGAVDGLRYLQVLLAGAPIVTDQFLDHQGRAEGEQETVERRLAIGRAQAKLEHHTCERRQQGTGNYADRVARAELQAQPPGAEFGAFEPAATD